MSRITLWEWRLDPRFVQWHGSRLLAVNEERYPLMIARHLDQAIAGSYKSAQVVIAARALEIRAGLARGVGPGGADIGDGESDVHTSYNVNILVKQENGHCVNLLIPRPPAIDAEATS